ncbi:alkaline phosphatase [Bacteroidota bacterium]
MIKFNKILVVGILVLFNYSCTEKGAPEQKIKPKNIILLIGDGMGVSQVSVSFYFNPDETNFKRFPSTGFINTSSSSHKITDSAAGATAFASGVKTFNGALGVDKEGVSKETLLEIASNRKMKTGVVSTSSITHATPAAFFSHVESRGMQEEIAEQLLNSEVDFFAGGGTKWIVNRSDNRNLYNNFVSQGFVMDTLNLASGGLDPGSKYGFLLSPDGMPAANKNRGDFLPEATNLAVDYLKHCKDGFFLAVEGSQIDWAGHGNEIEYMIAEMIDFDKAIGSALDFAEEDGNTLVIVTGDHETGGMALSPKVIQDGEKEYSDYNQPDLTFATGGHTTTLIPVFAYGPGSDEFNGVYENNEIFHKILKVTGWQ